jgi:hypothetical protein
VRIEVCIGSKLVIIFERKNTTPPSRLARYFYRRYIYDSLEQIFSKNG